MRPSAIAVLSVALLLTLTGCGPTAQEKSLSECLDVSKVTLKLEAIRDELTPEAIADRAEKLNRDCYLSVGLTPPE